MQKGKVSFVEHFFIFCRSGINLLIGFGKTIGGTGFRIFVLFSLLVLLVVFSFLNDDLFKFVGVGPFSSLKIRNL